MLIRTNVMLIRLKKRRERRSILFVGAPRRARDTGGRKIGIITVIDASTTKGALKYAMTTVACYAKVQRYEYRIVNESLYYEKCTQTKPEFRRHCIVGLLLPNYDYILFVDAHIGVVNPKRRIEEFIDDRADIVLYDQFRTPELMSGSYLIRNSTWAYKFLDEWANYEKRLPQSFYASESAALYGTAWARDSFVTDGTWSLPRDFMLHGVKSKLRLSAKTPENMLTSESDSTYSWYSKFAGEIELRRCYPGNTTWRYKRAYFIDDAKLEERYRRLHRKIYYEKLLSLGRVHDILRDSIKKPEKYIFRESGWADA
ncbi:hypothetical protein NECAME_07987 [Necator americanus]|uniref:Uncharacterized protein n=1 Tax=Necator americanus TaxID=51031 RepID=W2TK04_NECAM|nr:hypothetical protein NECAME_07987 [Necator americanus]ETN82410.1 hypothetical protein NECAME_07987 [Necator americanus]